MTPRLLISSDEYKVRCGLNYGHLYLILTSVPGVQSQIFSLSKGAIAHINSFFEGAHKVPPYATKFTSKRVEYFRSKFNVPNLLLTNNSFYEQIVFVMLNELDVNNIAIVETIGLSNDSISYLINFCYSFLNINKDKLIVLIHPEHQRVEYPEFLLFELDDEKVRDTTGWLKELDSRFTR